MELSVQGYMNEDVYFTAESYVENDNSITLSLNEIDLVENGKTEQNARMQMANSILEYAKEFNHNFEYYSIATNRKKHIPYIVKALTFNDVQKLADVIICYKTKISGGG